MIWTETGCWQEEKLTDRGFTCSVFKDVGNLLLDGIVDIGWFEARSNQSTSRTKIVDRHVPDKRENAHFVNCRNYLSKS